MNFNRKHLETQFAMCLVCGVIAAQWGYNLTGTEEGEGAVTGPALIANQVGCVLFFLSAGITFYARCLPSILAGLASIMAIPIYLYFVTPRFFQSLFTGLYKYPSQDWIKWNLFGCSTVIFTIITGGIAVYTLLKSRYAKSVDATNDGRSPSEIKKEN